MTEKQISCCGVVIINNDSTILVQTPSGKWGFPKGKRHKGEENIDTACRELEEETGITSDMINFIQINDEYCTHVEHTIKYYVAELKDNTQKITFTYDKDELTTVEWIKIIDALRLDNDVFRQSRKDILNSALDLFNNRTSVVSYNAPHFPPKQKKEEIKINKKKNDDLIINKKKDDDIKDKKKINISKSLSYLLRHGLVENNLKNDEGGYVLLSDVMESKVMKNFEGLTEGDILDVVSDNEKQRFSTITKNDKLYIRANQGHSKIVGDKINDGVCMTKIEQPLDLCFHGTTKKNILLIQKSGLNRMDRKHIHFASKHDAISGIKSSSKVLVHINMEEAMKDGIVFYKSDNDVILTEGKDGVVDAKYFKKVEYL